jgi:hypothetical protein
MDLGALLLSFVLVGLGLRVALNPR